MEFICIIDSNNYYIDYDAVVDGNATINEEDSRDGESLIKTCPPRPDMLKPRRIGITKSNPNGTSWEETATPEEIEAAKTEPPPPPLPNIEERLQATEKALIEMAGEIYG